MSDLILRADAFRLPFVDGSFQVVVADPPYRGKNRGKKGIGYAAVGYVPFTGREWWHEAMRVLAPSGHLYIFSAVREVWEWSREIAEAPVDIIGWVAPNNASLSAYWGRGIGGRAPAWRPVLHWQTDSRAPIVWDGGAGRTHALTGRPLAHEHDKGVFVDPNVCITAAIQSNMREALPWPNQLPLKFLCWLLRPHRGARVLDLFAGTGTTRVACLELGLSVVSVDLSPQAVALAAHRPSQLGMGL